jgi:predicted TIM-barrel fold metal-dependent hydrolase
MDELGVEKAVNLSGGWDDRLERNLARYAAHAPDRLLLFANIDFSRIDEPEFGARRADELRAWKARGVAGLKVFKGLGLTERDAGGKLIRIDDPRLDPIWAACGALKMPVLIHSADPPAFFEPVDRYNERWMQLTRRPNWSFFGPQFPSRDEVLAQRDRVLARHRQTVFIVAHLGEHGDDLAVASRWLDTHPNVYTDLSGREAELGRQPYAARRFLERYSHRVLFGTDRYPGTREQPRHRIYYRLLESQDEYFDYFDHPFPPTGEWKVYGLFLADDVLRRIYRENASRALAGEMPTAALTTTRPTSGPAAP